MNEGGVPGTESPSAAESPASPHQAPDRAEVLLAAARRLAEAERRGDVRVLEELIAADYAGYDPAGRRQDRASVLRSYADGRVRVTTLGQSELLARVVGEAGVVSGTSEYQGHQGDERFEFRLRFLDVYAWRDARWQLIASQDTLLPR